jgi:hypothetical protein
VISKMGRGCGPGRDCRRLRLFFWELLNKILHLEDGEYGKIEGMNEMRLVAGLVLGIVLGFAMQGLTAPVQSENDFITGSRIFQRGYIAGISDTLVALGGIARQGGPNQAKHLQSTIDLSVSCMDRAKTLDELTDRAIKRVKAVYNPAAKNAYIATDAILVWPSSNSPPCR